MCIRCNPPRADKYRTFIFKYYLMGPKGSITWCRLVYFGFCTMYPCRRLQNGHARETIFFLHNVRGLQLVISIVVMRENIRNTHFWKDPMNPQTSNI